MMSRQFRILAILAAIMGADGVILAAAAAHQPDASRLASASSMLLFHALAVLAVVALVLGSVVFLMERAPPGQRGVAGSWPSVGSILGFLLGSTLGYLQARITRFVRAPRRVP